MYNVKYAECEKYTHKGDMAPKGVGLQTLSGTVGETAVNIETALAKAQNILARLQYAIGPEQGKMADTSKSEGLLRDVGYIGTQTCALVAVLDEIGALIG